MAVCRNIPESCCFGPLHSVPNSHAAMLTSCLLTGPSFIQTVEKTPALHVLSVLSGCFCIQSVCLRQSIIMAGCTESKACECTINPAELKCLIMHALQDGAFLLDNADRDDPERESAATTDDEVGRRRAFLLIARCFMLVLLNGNMH